MALQGLLAIAVALLCVLALQADAAVTNPLLLGCNATFFSQVEFAGGDVAKQCSAYSELNVCLTQVVIQASAGSLQQITVDAESIVTDAVSTPTLCDLSSMGFGKAGNNLPLDLAQGEDVSFTQYVAETAAASETAGDIMNLGMRRNDLASNTAAQVATAAGLVTPLNNVLNSLIDNMFDASIAALNVRLGNVGNRIDSLKAAAAGIPTTIVNAQATLNSQINNEASTRTNIAAQWASSLTPLEAMVVTRTNAATADRSNIRASRVNNNPAATITGLFSTASINEAARAVTEAATQSTTFSSIRATLASSISTRVSTEASRADASCSSKASALTFLPPRLSNATQDDNACTLTGSMYYSRIQNVMYICNGSSWVPFLPSYSTSGFACTSILSAYSQDQMSGLLGRNFQYSRCYSAPTHGWSSYTMYSNCANKGTGTLWVVRNNYGWIHGAFTPLQLSGGQGWRHDYGHFTYRVSPQSGNLELLYPIGYGAGSYGYYDQSSYCMHFGGGTDVYLTSGCQSGHTYTYTYCNPQINFFQTSSWIAWYTPCPSCLYISDIEVWIRF